MPAPFDRLLLLYHPVAIGKVPVTLRVGGLSYGIVGGAENVTTWGTSIRTDTYRATKTAATTKTWPGWLVPGRGYVGSTTFTWPTTVLGGVVRFTYPVTSSSTAPWDGSPFLYETRLVFHRPKGTAGLAILTRLPKGAALWQADGTPIPMGEARSALVHVADPEWFKTDFDQLLARHTLRLGRTGMHAAKAYDYSESAYATSQYHRRRTMSNLSAEGTAYTFYETRTPRTVMEVLDFSFADHPSGSRFGTVAGLPTHLLDASDLRATRRTWNGPTGTTATRDFTRDDEPLREITTVRERATRQTTVGELATSWERIATVLPASLLGESTATISSYPFTEKVTTGIPDGRRPIKGDTFAPQFWYQEEMGLLPWRAAEMELIRRQWDDGEKGHWTGEVFDRIEGMPQALYKRECAFGLLQGTGQGVLAPNWGPNPNITFAGPNWTERCTEDGRAFTTTGVLEGRPRDPSRAYAERVAQRVTGSNDFGSFEFTMPLRTYGASAASETLFLRKKGWAIEQKSAANRQGGQPGAREARRPLDQPGLRPPASYETRFVLVTAENQLRDPRRTWIAIHNNDRTDFNDFVNAGADDGYGNQPGIVAVGRVRFRISGTAEETPGPVDFIGGEAGRGAYVIYPRFWNGSASWPRATVHS